MRVKNFIAKNSPLYGELLEAVKIKDSLERFETCYDLIHAANYEDIHYIITTLKELKATGKTPIKITDTITSFFELFLGKSGEKAILMDLLKEARKRKRKAD